MNRTDATAMAADLDARAPHGTRYEVRRTDRPDGCPSFYVKRVVRRRDLDPDRETTLPAAPAMPAQAALNI